MYYILHFKMFLHVKIYKYVIDYNFLLIYMLNVMQYYEFIIFRRNSFFPLLDMQDSLKLHLLLGDY